MAIQRQATDPGKALQATNTIRYSLTNTRRPQKKPEHTTGPVPRLSVTTDLVVTVIVFGILLAVVFFLQTRLR